MNAHGMPIFYPRLIGMASPAPAGVNQDMPSGLDYLVCFLPQGRHARAEGLGMKIAGVAVEEGQVAELDSTSLSA